MIEQQDAADPGSEGLQDAGDEPPAAFGLADEDSEVTSATDEAVVAQPEQGDDGADLGAENVQDVGDGFSEATDQETGDEETCGYCHHDFGPGEPRHVVNGRLYHGGF